MQFTMHLIDGQVFFSQLAQVSSMLNCSHYAVGAEGYA
jgi:hypothetical protein